METNLRELQLSTKYTVTEGTILINGNQALARLPAIQQSLDAQNGLNTAGFISGYRGSPLGGLDAALWQTKDYLKSHSIYFQPGVNEDLAATAITGTQQLDTLPDAKVDGVFSMWYGKGPGVDRSLDAFKHGNFSGSHTRGGVLVCYGDDHPGKSSTVCNQSEQALASIMMPSLYPANVEEFIEYGLLGFAMSRYTGLWVGFKCVNETVEQTATVDINIHNFSVETPDRGTLTPEDINYHPIAADRQADERLMTEVRVPLVHQFVRANKIDKVTHGTGTGKLAIVTSGKAWQDIISALQLLEIDEAKATQLGISVYKVGCIWPLEPEGITALALANEELLFVEEKKGILEEQAARILYNLPNRPKISGKVSAENEPLISGTAQLDALEVARVIGSRLSKSSHFELPQSLQSPSEGSAPSLPPAVRAPYFCSGCPHNTSTKLPAGSFGMSGIGCHGMAGWYRADTMLPLQMGGEGTNWIGLAPFTNTKHVFQNLGDGTYYHSGLLAIRAACAAGVNITYKILYNDAVAMTGGQPVDGPISVGEISHQVIHEGVKRCVVVSDAPEKFKHKAGIANGVEVYHRDLLDQVQRELREIPGCTVLIYEQTCAAEKRRRRKRGKLEDPAKRMYINPEVCEGCGDCSAKSTCVSIQPMETAMGRKRRIDQSSCNKDFSCNKGFCPSFVTLYGAEPKKPDNLAFDDVLLEKIPLPTLPEFTDSSYNIMIAGVGGTGVITVGAVLGMAAHLEHKRCSIYDMTGLSQKNGAVYSHLKIAEDRNSIGAQQIGQQQANLLLGFDLVASFGSEAFQSIRHGFTQIVGNRHISPTARFQLDPDNTIDSDLCERQLASQSGENNIHLIDATGMALALCGDTIAGNMFLVGYAFQKGLLPLSQKSILRAIELNGTAVDFNCRAFNLGRLAVHSPTEVNRMVESHRAVVERKIPTSLEEIVAHRVAHLTKYQDANYAERYRGFIDKVASVERKATGTSDKLAPAVARGYAKLLAYKDEYEVARMYSSKDFIESLKNQFSGDFRIELNLAPPLLSRIDPATGEPTKRAFGSWIIPVFRAISSLKKLRGGPFDIFGYTEERRMERKLITDYEAQIEEILTNLTTTNLEKAIALATLPDSIRGYGHVKERNVEAARVRWDELRMQFLNDKQDQIVKIHEIA